MPPRPVIARALALCLVTAAACADDELVAPSTLPCGGCAAGQRCYAPTRECVLASVASCSPPCAAYEQCSPRAPSPTCFAQVCTLPQRPAPETLKVVAIALVPSAGACDLDGDGHGDARLSDLTDGYAALPQSLDAAIAADRVTVFLQRLDTHLDVLFGTLAADSLRCNPASPTAGCRYTVSRDSYDRGARTGPCPAWLTLPDAAVSGSMVRAGGARHHVGVAAPVGAGQFLLQMYGVRADGVLTTANGRDASLVLRVCGAVPRAELIAALDGLPADTLAPVGGLSAARSLLGLALRPDIDGDGDGAAESVSFALRLTAVASATTGWSPAR